MKAWQVKTTIGTDSRGLRLKEFSSYLSNSTKRQNAKE